MDPLSLGALLKWPAIIAGAIAGLALLRWRVRKGAADQATAEQEARHERKARKDAETFHGRMRDRARRSADALFRGRLRAPRDPGKDDPPADR